MHVLLNQNVNIRSRTVMKSRHGALSETEISLW